MLYVLSSHIAEYGSRNPARGQLNRKNNIPLSPCVPENQVVGKTRKSSKHRDYLLWHNIQAKDILYIIYMKEQSMNQSSSYRHRL